MAALYDYSLQCQALQALVPEETIKVTHWQGTEAVSRPYRFEVTFAVRSANLALETLLNQSAALHAYRPDNTPIVWHGIVTQGTQLGCDETYDYYQIVLEPRLALLRNFKWSDVYLNQQLDDVIRQLLRLASLDEPYSSPDAPYNYRIVASQLAGTRMPFMCQFEETCLDFLMRKLEFYGVYFWFEQGAQQESVVFANAAQQQPADADSVVYYPKGVIDPDAQEIAVTRLNRRVALHPDTVTLHDSNDLLNTTQTLASQTQVPSPVAGFGEVHSSDDHFEKLSGSDTIAGQTLTTWRSEELACQRLRIDGQARTPGICAGRTISVSEYLRGTDVTQYYVTEVQHEGRQTIETAPESDEAAYVAGFVALPRWLDSDDTNAQPLQFRPPRLTPVPVVSCMVNGFIDIDTPDAPKQFAQTDENGRYKVRLSFPRQRYAGNQNSAWLRMATPYAGGSPSSDVQNAGMHFPLREGTEVLIAFLNGNPDRPVIMAALPNVEAPSVVNANNAAEHVIRTPSGNVLAMADGTGATESANTQDQSIDVGSYVHVYSSNNQSTLNLGNYTSSGLPAGFNLTTTANGTINADESMLISVPGHMRIAAGSQGVDRFLSTSVQNLPSGISIGTTGGIVVQNFIGARLSSTESLDFSHFFGTKVDLSEAVKFSFSAALELNISATKTKQVHLLQKNSYVNDGTVIGTALNWVGSRWNGTLLEKSETAVDINVSAKASYRLEAGTYKVCAISGGEPIISAAAGMLNLSTGSFVVSATTSTSISTKSFSLYGQAAIDLLSSGPISMSSSEPIKLSTDATITLFGSEVTVIGEFIKIG